MNYFSFAMEKLTLTPAEYKIFELIQCRNKEIAQKLNISIRTVESHIANILNKNNVKNKVALALLNIRGVEVEVINNIGNPKLTPTDKTKIRELKETMTAAAIAERYQVNEETIWNAIKKPLS
jgi:DNA-binding CsgD family transcriptional regulator